MKRSEFESADKFARQLANVADGKVQLPHRMMAVSEYARAQAPLRLAFGATATEVLSDLIDLANWAKSGDDPARLEE